MWVEASLESFSCVEDEHLTLISIAVDVLTTRLSNIIQKKNMEDIAQKLTIHTGYIELCNEVILFLESIILHNSCTCPTGMYVFAKSFHLKRTTAMH